MTGQLIRTHLTLNASDARAYLICRKLALRPGDRVLGVGCGVHQGLAAKPDAHGRTRAPFTREEMGLPVRIENMRQTTSRRM